MFFYYLMQVLGIESGASAKAESTLNHSSVSPALTVIKEEATFSHWWGKCASFFLQKTLILTDYSLKQGVGHLQPSLLPSLHMSRLRTSLHINA